MRLPQLTALARYYVIYLAFLSFFLLDSTGITRGTGLYSSRDDDNEEMIMPTLESILREIDETVIERSAALDELRQEAVSPSTKIERATALQKRGQKIFEGIKQFIDKKLEEADKIGKRPEVKRGVESGRKCAQDYYDRLANEVERISAASGAPHTIGSLKARFEGDVLRVNFALEDKFNEAKRFSARGKRLADASSNPAQKEAFLDEALSQAMAKLERGRGLQRRLDSMLDIIRQEANKIGALPELEKDMDYAVRTCQKHLAGLVEIVDTLSKRLQDQRAAHATDAPAAGGGGGGGGADGEEEDTASSLKP